MASYKDSEPINDTVAPNYLNMEGGQSSENIFDAYKQSRFIYNFAPDPSGADPRFLLPREHPKLTIMGYVDIFDSYFQRGVAEFFALFRFLFSILVTILMELTKFFVAGLAQPLTVGTMTICGAYCLQPFYVVMHNHFMGPTISFCYNMLAAIVRMLQPAVNLCDQVGRILANIIAAFRPCNIQIVTNPGYMAADASGKIQTV